MKILVVLFLTFSQVLIAQQKVQIPVKNNDQAIRLINLGREGFVFLSRQSNNQLEIQKYNTDMLLDWNLLTVLDSKSDLLKESIQGNMLYLLIENSNSHNYEILKVSTAFGAIQKYTAPRVKNFNISHFKALDSLYCMAGSVKDQPLVMLYDPISNQSNFISAGFKGITFIESMEIAESMIDVAYINRDKKNNQLQLITYGKDGDVIQQIKVEQNPKFDFISAKIFRSNGKRFLVGNYGFRSNSSSQSHTSSQGVYIFHDDQLKYYGFDKFKNFFAILNEKQKTRLEKQIQKKKEKGSEVAYNYRLNIQDLKEENEQLILVSDVFIPEFRNYNPYFGSGLGYGFGGGGLYYSFNYWGRANNYLYNPIYWGHPLRNSTYFDGFNYLEGVIFSFDNQGEIVWDAAFPFAQRTKYYDLTPHLKVGSRGSNLVASYEADGALQVVTINSQGESIEKNVISKKDADLTRKKDFSYFEFWYNDYFLVRSFEKNESDAAKTRQVFEIQKVKIEPGRPD